MDKKITTHITLPLSPLLHPTQPLPLPPTSFTHHSPPSQPLPPPHSLSPTITVSPRSPAFPRWRSVPRCLGCQWGGTENSVRTSLSGTYNLIKIYKQSIRSISASIEHSSGCHADYFLMLITPPFSLSLTPSSLFLSILYVTVFICCWALPYG